MPLSVVRRKTGLSSAAGGPAIVSWRFAAPLAYAGGSLGVLIGI